MLFNSIQIDSKTNTELCPHEPGCDGSTHFNLPTELKPRHLSIVDPVRSDRVPILSSLVRRYASQIQYLTLPDILFLEEVLRTDDQTLSFPLLEEFSVQGSEQRSHEEQKDLLSRMTGKCPRIKKLCVLVLYIVPEDHYWLVGDLIIRADDFFRDQTPFQNLAQVRPKLKHLLWIVDSVDGRDERSEQAFRNCWTQLLGSSTESLEEICIETKRFETLHNLSHVQLKKLKKLRVRTHKFLNVNSFEQFWGAFKSVDVSKTCPKLEEFELVVNLGWEEDVQVWAPNFREQLDGFVRHSYNSVRKLVLCFRNVTTIRISMAEIKAIFPHLTSLELLFCGFVSEDIPCEVAEVWPNLEYLKIHGGDCFVTRNYDADFLGINEEEAEELRGKDEEYLRTVQIVPIRPSLLTMKSKF